MYDFSSIFGAVAVERNLESRPRPCLNGISLSETSVSRLMVNFRSCFIHSVDVISMLTFSTACSPYPVSLTTGLLPQHSVRPPIHLDYRGCKSLSLNTGLSGIRTLVPRMGSQHLIHYAKWREKKNIGKEFWKCLCRIRHWTFRGCFSLQMTSDARSVFRFEIYGSNYICYLTLNIAIISDKTEKA